MKEKTMAEEQERRAPMPKSTPRKTPQVYCGPSVRGVARQYTVYAAGTLPAALKGLMEKHPEAAALTVPTERFAAVRRALGTKGTAEAILYEKLLEKLTQEG